ncbi:hypothetical protein [Rosistilla oblonga]|uniref:hypothetical protein n=1 Tax=Rosistilla oblonga TaxID=2527990 RepID=UPI003A979239
MLIEFVEQYKYQPRANQPMGAGPGSRAASGVSRGDDIPNRPRANQPMGVSPGCDAPTGVSRSYQVSRTGAGAHRLMGLGRFDIDRQGYDLSNQPRANQPVGVSPGSRAACGVSRGSRVQKTGANARRLMGLGRFDIARQGYDLSNQPRANQPVGVSPGSRAASGVRRGSRVQKTGAGAHRLMGLGRIDIARQGYDSSNQPCANQPVGVSPGSRSACGAGGGSRVLRTGANAHRLIELGRFDIVEQGYDLSINRYKEVVHEEIDHRPPQAILDELEVRIHQPHGAGRGSCGLRTGANARRLIAVEITQGMKQLRGMLK